MTLLAGLVVVVLSLGSAPASATQVTETVTYTDTLTSTDAPPVKIGQLATFDFGAFDFGAAFDTAINVEGPPADCSVKIDWGDGSQSFATVGDSVAGFHGISATHHYSAAGTYDTSFPDFGSSDESAGNCVLGVLSETVSTVTIGGVVLAQNTNYNYNAENYHVVVSALQLPQNTSPPTITGTPVSGQVLTEAHGTWSNNPTSYNYQWQDCDAGGNNCTNVQGSGISDTYTLGTSDVGSTIRVVETGVTADGPGVPTASVQTAVVTATSSTITTPTTPTTPITTKNPTSTPAPNTKITSGKVIARQHLVGLRFKAIGKATKFQCALTRVQAHKRAQAHGYSTCKSPKTYKHLKAGKYVFYVRAVGPGGTDKTPATRKFRIKK